MGVCYPGDRHVHAANVGGVAVDKVATVSTLNASGGLIAKAKVTRNIYDIDDDSPDAVRLVFKDRQGNVLMTIKPIATRCVPGMHTGSVEILPS